MAPRHWSAAVTTIVREPKARSIICSHRRRLAEVRVDLRTDGTADCETCHMPMFPIAMTEAAVTLECANRHRASEPLPDDAKLRRFIQNWVARKGAQMEEQRKRWEAESDAE
jgi:hypothetical protein